MTDQPIAATPVGTRVETRSATSAVAPAATDITTLAARLADVLGRSPAGFLTDFDGVLSELSATPDAAVIHPDVERSLHRIAARVDIAGIVTGRAAADVRTKTDTDGLVVVGNHGLETWIHGEHVEHDAGLEAVLGIEAAIVEIRELLERDRLIEGVIFENKRLSASIHYRQAPHPKQVASILIPLARRIAVGHNLRMTEGKLIVELRPMAEVSKGTALRSIVERFDLTGVVFMGDDLTDVDGFIGIKALRDAGVIAAVAVGVIGADSHPLVAETADVTIPGVAGVAELMAALAVELERNGAV